MGRASLTTLIGIFENPEFHRSGLWGQQEISRKKMMDILQVTSVRKLVEYIDSLIINRKGIVLSLTSQVLQFPREEADHEDIAIQVPQGLPITCINGIEPLGEFEWNEIVEGTMRNVSDIY